MTCNDIKVALWVPEQGCGDQEGKKLVVLLHT